MTPDEFGRAIGWVGGCLYLVDWIEHRARAWWSRVKYERQQAKIEACMASGGHAYRVLERSPDAPKLPGMDRAWQQCDRCGVCTVVSGSG